MLLVKKTEKTENILRMPERCRNLIPVSKGNRGNKKIHILWNKWQRPIPSSLYLPFYECTDWFTYLRVQPAQLSCIDLDYLHVACRVTRFFLVEHTKTGKMYQMTIKYVYQMVTKIPNCRMLYQTAIKYTGILH
jgi:hypothetical protein